MCHFITATLSARINRDQVMAIFERYKLGFREISNPHITAQIRSGDLYILTTRGSCDCGTVLGSLHHTDGAEDNQHNSELDKLRERGWSETKIQRWLEEKERTQEKNLRERAARASAGMPQAEHWVQFINELLQSKQTPRLGLLLHLYSGGIESERIQIAAKKKAKMADISPDLLMEMQEDVLYEFVS